MVLLSMYDSFPVNDEPLPLHGELFSVSLQKLAYIMKTTKSISIVIIHEESL